MSTVALRDLVAALDTELRTTEVPDYPGAMNGLQVANRIEAVSCRICKSIQHVRQPIQGVVTVGDADTAGGS